MAASTSYQNTVDQLKEFANVEDNIERVTTSSSKLKKTDSGEPTESKSSKSENQEQSAAVEEPSHDELEHRKKTIRTVIAELTKLNSDIARINFDIISSKGKYDKEKKLLEIQKHLVLASDLDMNSKNCKSAQIEADLKMFLDTENKIYGELDTRKKKLQMRAKCAQADLEKMKKDFEDEHQIVVEKFEILKTKFVDTDLINEKLKYLENSYKREMISIAEFQRKLSNIIPNQDIVSLNEDFDCSSSSSLSTGTSKSSFDKLVSYLEKDVKPNPKDYIKKTLGDALVQGLAAMFIQFPADPIYFLANYLIQYQHNNFMYRKKEFEFKDLMEARKAANEQKTFQSQCVDCEGNCQM